MGLVPEKRFDRNGKLVTKHVKVSSSTTGSLQKPVARSPIASQISKKFSMDKMDVRKPRQVIDTKQNKWYFRIIRQFLGVHNDGVYKYSISASDNEIYDFMESGYSYASSIELIRCKATVEQAKALGLANTKMSQQALSKMRAKKFRPEAASRVIRHGIEDSMLGKGIPDDRLFAILLKENINVSQYKPRREGVRLIVTGEIEIDALDGLGEFELVAKYESVIKNRIKNGLSVDYKQMLAIAPHAQSYRDSRAMEMGWPVRSHYYFMGGAIELVDEYGPEILALNRFDVPKFTMKKDAPFEFYREVDSFLSLIDNSNDLLMLTSEQREDVKATGTRSITVASFVEKLLDRGATGEQALYCLKAGYGLDHSEQVAVNSRAEVLMDGWL